MKKNSFIEGTLIATISIVLVKIMGLLYVIPFYAIIGPLGGALYGYAYNIYNIFLTTSTTGIPVAISKIISEYNTLGYVEAKARAYKIGKKIVNILAVISFVLLFAFAKQIATIIIGDLTGGNTIEDVTIVIRAISFAILIIPFLSVTRGYFQGHKFIKTSSMSQILEQLFRIIIIICGSYIVVKVLNKSLTLAVSVAVSGAFFGGLLGAVYLVIKMRKNKKELGLEDAEKFDDITDKEILRKIAKYTIPYVILNVAGQLYTFVDMLLILRTLSHLGYNAKEIEFVTSSITTWAMKLNMIINSLAMGLAINLIPNIMQSFIKKDWKKVNLTINQTLEIIIVIAIPATVGISFLAKPIWTVFYGYSITGTTVLTYSIFTALFSTLYLTTISILQGLNKFKLAYAAGISGFLTNVILDVPLMILFSRLGLPAYYGAITATILGYSISVFWSLIAIRKEPEICYQRVLKTLFQTAISVGGMMLMLLILNTFLPYNPQDKLSSLITIVIKTGLGGLVYLFLIYKTGLIDKIFGREAFAKIIQKLTFNLVKIDLPRLGE